MFIQELFNAGALPRQVGVDAAPQQAEQHEHGEHGGGLGAVAAHRVHGHGQHARRRVPPPLRRRQRHATVGVDSCLALIHNTITYIHYTISEYCSKYTYLILFMETGLQIIKIKNETQILYDLIKFPSFTLRASGANW